MGSLALSDCQGEVRLEIDAAAVFFPIAIAGRIGAVTAASQLDNAVVRRRSRRLLLPLFACQQVIKADDRVAFRGRLGGLDANGAGGHVWDLSGQNRRAGEST